MVSGVEVKKPHFFSKKEVDRILLSVEADMEVYLFCKFLWRTGVRVSESLDVTPKDVDYTKGIVIVKTRKRRKGRLHYREIPIQQDFLKELQTYIISRAIPNNRPIFAFTSRTACNHVKKACNQAKYKDERSHPSSFRHSYALHCLKNGLAIHHVNDLLGNSDIKKTMLYLKFIPNKQPNLNKLAW